VGNGGRQSGARVIRTQPVTRDTWPDFAELFETKGCPHFCWCTIYRMPKHGDAEKAAKKKFMHDMVSAGTPIGILAYDGDEPIGWCSAAPRESYSLQRSRTMPRVTPDDVPTWTVLWFFVKRPHRKAGVTKTLLEAAITYARTSGAKVIEAYPADVAGVVTTHRGHSSVFAAAGFKADGKRWFRILTTSKRSAS